jgi:membrane-bound lytic murein transglycosylase D
MVVRQRTFEAILVGGMLFSIALAMGGCAGVPTHKTQAAPAPNATARLSTDTSSPKTASVEAPEPADSAKPTAVDASGETPRSPAADAPDAVAEDAGDTPATATLGSDTSAPVIDAAAPQERVGMGAPAGKAATATDHMPSPDSYTDLWDRIRAGFELPDVDDPLIAVHERWFQNNPEYMAQKTERARLYLYYIVAEIEKRNMPLEIALLPAIESAYQPHAYSRARALGLWQFIAPTARRYGIKMNWWYDGRRDVLSSTRAALDYLQELHDEFNGDWFLALAAYNAGEATIQYLIDYNHRHGLPTDYQHLRLKPETRNYVPKLLALAEIVAHPDRYGVKLTPIPNKPYFATVDIGSQIDLNVVSQLADVPIGDLYDINPGLNRWATAPNGPHRILVPVDRKEALIEGLNNLPEESRVRWRRHHVQAGDTLSVIARAYGVSVWDVQRVNGLRGTLIHVGQDLMIPISSRPLSVQVAHVTRPYFAVPPRPPGQAKLVHRVRAGETLWSIARRYGVYVSQLAKWNLISAQDILHVGQILNIWTSAGFQ